MESFHFSSQEKLKSKKSIDLLFKKGDRLFHYPLQLVFATAEHEESVRFKAAFSVPKKYHRHAVVRNKLKRRVKESFRLLAPRLRKRLEEKDERLIFMFVYISKEELTYNTIDKAVASLLRDLMNLDKAERSSK